MRSATIFRESAESPGRDRWRGDEDLTQREGEERDGDGAPPDTPDDGRNERRARQRVSVGAARPGADVEQIVADVVERVAGGECGEEDQHGAPQPGRAVASEQPQR